MGRGRWHTQGRCEALASSPSSAASASASHGCSTSLSDSPSCVSPLQGGGGEGRLAASHPFAAFTYAGDEAGRPPSLRGTPVKRSESRLPTRGSETRFGGKASRGDDSVALERGELGAQSHVATPKRPRTARREAVAPAMLLPSVLAATAVAALRGGGARVRGKAEKPNAVSASHGVSAAGRSPSASASRSPRPSSDPPGPAVATPPTSPHTSGHSQLSSLSPSDVTRGDNASPTDQRKRNSVLAFWEEIDRRRTLSPAEVAAAFACPVCGSQGMRFVTGRYGAFLGCSRFPACRGKRSGREVELWRAGEPAGQRKRNQKLTLTCEMESCTTFRVHAQGDPEVGELLRLALPAVIRGATAAFWATQRAQARAGAGKGEGEAAEAAQRMQWRVGGQDGTAEAPDACWGSGGERPNGEDASGQASNGVESDADAKRHTNFRVCAKSGGPTGQPPHRPRGLERGSRDCPSRERIPDFLWPRSWLPRVDRLKSRREPWSAFLPFICRAGAWLKQTGEAAHQRLATSSSHASDRRLLTRSGSDCPSGDVSAVRRQSGREELDSATTCCDEGLLRELLASLPGGARRSDGEECATQGLPSWDWTVGSLAPASPLLGGGVRREHAADGEAEEEAGARRRGESVAVRGESPGETLGEDTDPWRTNATRREKGDDGEEATEKATGKEDVHDLPYVDGCVFQLEAYEWIFTSLVKHASEWCHVAPIPGLTLRFFREYYDRTGRGENAFFLGDRQTALAIANHRMPPLLRKSLFPFQLEGVLFALQRSGRVLIGDQMGLGKTLQALALLSIYRAFPVLIVVPASLRLVWAEAIERWLPSLSCPPSSLLVIFGSDDRPALHAAAPHTFCAGSHSVALGPLLPAVSGTPPCDTPSFVSPADSVSALKPSSALPASSDLAVASPSLASLASLSSSQSSSPPRWAPSSAAFPVSASAPHGLTASPRIVLTSYEMTRRLPDFLSQMNFQMVIVDESHKLRTPASAGAVSGLEADMTRRVLQLIKAATYAVLLTGTPSVKHPFDLFSQVDALRPPMEPQAWRQRQARVKADWESFRRAADPSAASQGCGRAGGWTSLSDPLRPPVEPNASAQELPTAPERGATQGERAESGERGQGGESGPGDGGMGPGPDRASTAGAQPGLMHLRDGDEGEAARRKATAERQLPRRYAHEGNILRADRIQFGVPPASIPCTLAAEPSARSRPAFPSRSTLHAEEYCTSILTYGSRKRYGISARSWELHLLLTAAVLIRRRQLGSQTQPLTRGRPEAPQPARLSSLSSLPQGSAEPAVRHRGAPASASSRRDVGERRGSTGGENGEKPDEERSTGEDGEGRGPSEGDWRGPSQGKDARQGVEGEALAAESRGADQEVLGRQDEDGVFWQREANRVEMKSLETRSQDDGCPAVPPPCIRILQSLQLAGDNRAVHAIALATVLRRPVFSWLCQGVADLCEERQKSARRALARQTEAELGLGRRRATKGEKRRSAERETGTNAGCGKGPRGGVERSLSEEGGRAGEEETEVRGRKAHAARRARKEGKDEGVPGKRRKTEGLGDSRGDRKKQRRNEEDRLGREVRGDRNAGAEAQLEAREEDENGAQEEEGSQAADAQTAAVAVSTHRGLESVEGKRRQAAIPRNASRRREKAQNEREVRVGVRTDEAESERDSQPDVCHATNTRGAAGDDASVDGASRTQEKADVDLEPLNTYPALGGREQEDARSTAYLHAVEKITDALGGNIDRWTVKTEAERVGLSKVESALQWLHEKFLRDDAGDDSDEDDEDGNDGGAVVHALDVVCVPSAACTGSRSTKIVIFAHHRRVLDCLEQGLRAVQQRSHRRGRSGSWSDRCAAKLKDEGDAHEGPGEDVTGALGGERTRGPAFDFIRIDGSVTEEEKFKRRETFHKSPQCKIALLSVTASSHGVDLSNANVCVFVEMLPEQHELLQAEGRLQRRGQRRQVTTFFLINKFLGDDAAADCLGDETPAEGDDGRVFASDAEIHESLEQATWGRLASDTQEGCEVEQRPSRGGPSQEPEAETCGPVQTTKGPCTVADRKHGKRPQAPSRPSAPSCSSPSPSSAGLSPGAASTSYPASLSSSCRAFRSLSPSVASRAESGSLTPVPLSALLPLFRREVVREKRRLLAECERIDVSAWRRYSACAVAIHHVVDGPTRAVEGDAFPLKIHCEADWAGTSSRGESACEQKASGRDDAETRLGTDAEGAERSQDSRGNGDGKARRIVEPAAIVQTIPEETETPGRQGGTERRDGESGDSATGPHAQGSESACNRRPWRGALPVWDASTTSALPGSTTAEGVNDRKDERDMGNPSTSPDCLDGLTSFSQSKLVDERCHRGLCPTADTCDGSGDVKGKCGIHPEARDTQTVLRSPGRTAETGARGTLLKGEAANGDDLRVGRVSSEDLRFIVSPYTKRVHVLREWKQKANLSGVQSPPAHLVHQSHSASDCSASGSQVSSCSLSPAQPVPLPAGDCKTNPPCGDPSFSLSSPSVSPAAAEFLAPVPASPAGPSCPETEDERRCLSFAYEACLAVVPLGVSFPAEELQAPGPAPRAVAYDDCDDAVVPEPYGETSIPSSSSGALVLTAQSGARRAKGERASDMLRQCAARFYAEYLSLTSYQRRKLRKVYAPLGIHTWLASAAASTTGNTHAAADPRRLPALEALSDLHALPCLPTVSSGLPSPFPAHRAHLHGEAVPHEAIRDATRLLPRHWPRKLPRSFQNLPPRVYFEAMLRMQCMQHCSSRHVGEGETHDGNDPFLAASVWGPANAGSNYLVPSRYYLPTGERPGEPPGVVRVTARGAGKAAGVGRKEPRLRGDEAGSETREGDAVEIADKGGEVYLRDEAFHSGSTGAPGRSDTRTGPLAPARARRGEILSGFAASLDEAEGALTRRKGRGARPEEPNTLGDRGTEGTDNTAWGLVAKLAKTSDSGPRDSGHCPDLRWDEDEEDEAREESVFEERTERGVHARDANRRHSQGRSVNWVLPATPRGSGMAVSGSSSVQCRGEAESERTAGFVPGVRAPVRDDDDDQAVWKDRPGRALSARTGRRKGRGRDVTAVPSGLLDVQSSALENASEGALPPSQLTTSRFFPQPPRQDFAALSQGVPSHSTSGSSSERMGRPSDLSPSSSETNEDARICSGSGVARAQRTRRCPALAPAAASCPASPLPGDDAVGETERDGDANHGQVDCRCPKDEPDSRVTYVKALVTYSRLGGSSVTYYQPVLLRPARPAVNQPPPPIESPASSFSRGPCVGRSRDSSEGDRPERVACSSSPPQPLCLMCFQPLVAVSTTRKWCKRAAETGGGKTKAKEESVVSHAAPTPAGADNADGSDAPKDREDGKANGDENEVQTDSYSSDATAGGDADAPRANTRAVRPKTVKGLRASKRGEDTKHEAHAVDEQRPGDTQTANGSQASCCKIEKRGNVGTRVQGHFSRHATDAAGEAVRHGERGAEKQGVEPCQERASDSSGLGLSETKKGDGSDASLWTDLCSQEWEVRCSDNDLFCSGDCRAAFFARKNADSLRRQVFRSDRGICCSCGIDCVALLAGVKAMRAAGQDAATIGAFIGSFAPAFRAFPTLCALLIREPVDGNAWHADHIIPVHQGGGLCDLTNVQTLCRACHQLKTNHEASLRAHRSWMARHGELAAGDKAESFTQ
ncbi:conserved hypothetical protein [Neospora caninum Liverpool]|uniref:Helicase ATP-binding domain-containing protein n=1 Tax=Neospora caninum (strain Liverpool) TaxID=572307 RepID=F0VIP5_NEOCL|nr:conserved hypothetical protein [Neospora caninum Liverpool]CBZ53606.1 conserved hypothetical protein [Neospora caninum Liverpool]|eukprot:XP_003883638.1 conserved hypothetical protein [Neospora caninum Liverpool]